MKTNYMSLFKTDGLTSIYIYITAIFIGCLILSFFLVLRLYLLAA